MVSKFVIDGAPGSGKTTLLFGLTVDGETDKNIVCLKNFNFKIIPEAISTIADQMRKEGKVPTDAVDELVKRTINKAIEESSRDYKEVCFIERGLPGYFFMEDIFKIKLPKKYLEYQNILKYDSPIFILEPIYSFDMSKNNKQLRKGRVATLEQRKDIFQKTIEIYKKLGYEVEMVPNYDDDVKKNNRKRIEHILKFIPNNI